MEHIAEDIVFRRDRRAVVPDQIADNLKGVGLGAIFVGGHNRIRGADRGIQLELTGFVRVIGRIAAVTIIVTDQILDVDVVG